ncbi:MAG: hypothetical protein JXA50_01860 [Deltaproteobacteria bacterium]|nr:hypothetical protein [Deltaproteobacteria bacterium]
MDPFKPTGIGANDAMNVLKWVFSKALSAPPKLKAWDDYLMDSTVHRVFAGTEGNGDKPMIGGIGCDEAPSADWFPTEKVVAAAVNVASLLMGSEGFCQLSASGPEAEGEVFANINFKFPFDAAESDAYGGVLTVEYEYTSEPPDVTAYGNKGTEETPDWQALVMGIKGYAPESGVCVLRPCNAGEGPNGTGTWFLTFPKTGQAHPGEIWCKEHEA